MHPKLHQDLGWFLLWAVWCWERFCLLFTHLYPLISLAYLEVSWNRGTTQSSNFPQMGYAHDYGNHPYHYLSLLSSIYHHCKTPVCSTHIPPNHPFLDVSFPYKPSTFISRSPVPCPTNVETKSIRFANRDSTIQVGASCDNRCTKSKGIYSCYLW